MDRWMGKAVKQRVTVKGESFAVSERFPMADHLRQATVMPILKHVGKIRGLAELEGEGQVGGLMDGTGGRRAWVLRGGEGPVLWDSTCSRIYGLLCPSPILLSYCVQANVLHQ